MLAFSTLFFRALLVYAELGVVLIQNHFNSQHENKKNPALRNVPLAVFEKLPQRKSRRGSAGSGSNGGSMTPRVLDSGLSVYSGGREVRDFEGVGGWRIPGTVDEDALWTSMNSRLELPALVEGTRHSHHRSTTSGSLTSVSLPLKSPVRSRARTPSSVRVEESISPDEYFANRSPSRLANTLDAANIGKALLHHTH